MDKNKLYKDKFINFLKDNKLYHYRVVKYFFKYATFNDFSNFDLTKALDNWGYIYNRENQLIKFIPCTPALESDRAVLFNIIAYIRTLFILININFSYLSSSTFDYKAERDEFESFDDKKENVNELSLLFYYGMLYLKDNPNLILSYNEKQQKRKILKHGSDIQQAIFKFCEQALKNNDDSSINNITRLAKNKLRKK